MKCPKCGHKVPFTDKFCVYCGRPLAPKLRIPVRGKWLMVLAVIGIAGIIAVMLPKIFIWPSNSNLPSNSNVPLIEDTPPYIWLTPPTIESEYTTKKPEMDGIMTPGEWNQPAFNGYIQYSLGDDIKNGDVTGYFMNDDTNLYAAITISIPDLREGLLEENGYYYKVELHYDANGDGLITVGEFSRVFEGTEYSAQYLTGEAWWRHTSSDVVPGKGAMAYSTAINGYAYEMEIPLDSGNPLDLTTKAGNSIAIKILVSQWWSTEKKGQTICTWGWPYGRGELDVDTFAKLILATESRPYRTQQAVASDTHEEQDLFPVNGWPTSGHDFQRTGRTTYIGPDSPVLKWQVGGVGEAPLIGADGTLYYPSYHLFAVNPDDGSIKWQFNESGGEASLGPDGTIYFSTYEWEDQKNYLYAVDSNGQLKWKIPVEGGNSHSSAPVITADNTVYFSLVEYGEEDVSQNWIYALNSNGTLKWKYNHQGLIIGSLVLGNNGNIYFATYGYDSEKGERVAYLKAINPDGDIVKDFNVGGYYIESFLISSDGTIYMLVAGVLWALNSDGSFKWQGPCLGWGTGSMAMQKDGTIIVNGEDVVYGKNEIIKTTAKISAVGRDGRLKWEFITEGRCSPALTIDGKGTIYTGFIENNMLYALNPDGSLKWKFDLGEQTQAPLVIDSNGVIYAGFGQAISSGRA